MSNTVEELLIKNGIHYNVSGKDFVTRCFNPDHADTNPSFRIDKVSGIAHCFSCGHKLNLFKFYGIISTGNHIRVAKLKEKIQNIKNSIYGIGVPKGFTPVSKVFRGVSVNTLKLFDAGFTTMVPELEDRIIFPIKDITGKVLVYVARHTMSSGNPRYINYPAGATMPIFPARPMVLGHKSLVLVEGIFDMLNLYDKGLTNVACCFGTNTLKNSIREKLQPYKACGVSKIFIMFDGDFAGKKAAEELKPLIEELEFIVDIIHLEEDTDPGELEQEDIDSIIEYIK